MIAVPDRSGAGSPTMTSPVWLRICLRCSASVIVWVSCSLDQLSFCGGVCYFSEMRTTVSLPESLVRKADRFVRRLRKSRNQLYTEAIAEYLVCHTADDITESMNAVCDEIDQVDDGFVS